MNIQTRYTWHVVIATVIADKIIQFSQTLIFFRFIDKWYKIRPRVFGQNAFSLYRDKAGLPHKPHELKFQILKFDTLSSICYTIDIGGKIDAHLNANPKLDVLENK